MVSSALVRVQAGAWCIVYAMISFIMATFAFLSKVYWVFVVLLVMGVTFSFISLKALGWGSGTSRDSSRTQTLATTARESE